MFAERSQVTTKYPTSMSAFFQLKQFENEPHHAVFYAGELLEKEGFKITTSFESAPVDSKVWIYGHVHDISSTSSGLELKFLLKNFHKEEELIPCIDLGKKLFGAYNAFDNNPYCSEGSSMRVYGVVQETDDEGKILNIGAIYPSEPSFEDATSVFYAPGTILRTQLRE